MIIHGSPWLLNLLHEYLWDTKDRFDAPKKNNFIFPTKFLDKCR